MKLQKRKEIKTMMTRENVIKKIEVVEIRESVSSIGEIHVTNIYAKGEAPDDWTVYKDNEFYKAYYFVESEKSILMVFFNK